MSGFARWIRKAPDEEITLHSIARIAADVCTVDMGGRGTPSPGSLPLAGVNRSRQGSRSDRVAARPCLERGTEAPQADESFLGRLVAFYDGTRGR